jgi:Predicted metal-dependent hydrolase
MKYDFNIIIKRTNRKKTVSFRIKNQEVIISVPKFLSDNEIYNLVEIKIKWIKNKLALEKLNNVSIKRKYENGDIFLYLGSEYSLKIKKSHKDNIYIKDKNLIVEAKNVLATNNIKNNIKNWYIDESKKYLTKTNSYYEILIGVKSNKLLFGQV